LLTKEPVVAISNGVVAIVVNSNENSGSTV
jgi:hypothetical protein